MALQQQPRKYVILDDKKGGFKIYDVESVLGTFAADGSYTFDAKGSPMRGFSKEQGLAFSMRAMDGVAARTDAGSFRIQKAQANGAVVLDTTSEGPESTTTKGHLATEALSLAEGADSTTVTIPGAFTYTNHATSPTVDRLIELRAPSGTFVLPLLDQSSGTNNPFRSANVRGPVNVTVDSKRTGANGTDRQLLKVRGDAMTYDGARRVLRITGDVVADVELTPAKGEPLAFVSNLAFIEIEFDEDSGFKTFSSGAGGVSSKDGGG
jgi:hypothetical protein